MEAMRIKVGSFNDGTYLQKNFTKYMLNQFIMGNIGLWG